MLSVRRVRPQELKLQSCEKNLLFEGNYPTGAVDAPLKTWIHHLHPENNLDPLHPMSCSTHPDLHPGGFPVMLSADAFFV